MSTFDALDNAGARVPEIPDPQVDEDLRWGIERQFRDLESLFQAHVCIHDVSGVFRMPDGEPWFLPNRIIHQAPICRFMHTNACIEHCSRAQNEIARKKAVPFMHHCWKGAAELVVPLIHQGTHLATLFIGAAKGRIALNPKDFPKKIMKTQEQLPDWSIDKQEQMQRLFLAFGNHLIYQLEHYQIVDEQDDRQTLIRRWLQMHAHEPVSLADLAQALSLSASRCSHVVQECFGQSFRSLLHHERLERARRLLLNSRSLAISEIAHRAGFEDERHFSRSFKKKFADAPGRYRRRYQVG